MGHEHCKAGEVCAGAAGVCAIRCQQTTVLRRPESRHGAFGVAPERTVGIEVLLRMLGAKEENEKEEQERERERKKEREKNQKGGGMGEQDEREQILSHGEVGGRNIEWWESQKRSEKKSGRKWRRKKAQGGRDTERESSTHNNKTTNRRDRMQQQINMEPWQEVAAMCPRLLSEISGV